MREGKKMELCINGVCFVYYKERSNSEMISDARSP